MYLIKLLMPIKWINKIKDSKISITMHLLRKLMKVRDLIFHFHNWISKVEMRTASSSSYSPNPQSNLRAGSKSLLKNNIKKMKVNISLLEVMLIKVWRFILKINQVQLILTYSNLRKRFKIIKIKRRLLMW